jgi:hypothetical protein
VDTCGFTISGAFEGAGFGIDGWGLYGTSSFSANGGTHLVWDNQSVIFDFYRTGGAEYLRLYMAPGAGMAAAQALLTLRAIWSFYGLTSNPVIKASAAGKWVKLTAVQQRKVNAGLGVPLTSGALGAAIARGSGTPWKAGGTTTVNGVRCVVLTDPANKTGPGYLGESIYVNAATGLPVQIRYVSQDSQRVTSNFGSWGRIGAVTPPPAAKVIADGQAARLHPDRRVPAHVHTRGGPGDQGPGPGVRGGSHRG